MYFISEISETIAHTPSSIINGTYSISIEAIQAILAPIKFNKINPPVNYADELPGGNTKGGDRSQ